MDHKGRTISYQSAIITIPFSTYLTFEEYRIGINANLCSDLYTIEMYGSGTISCRWYYGSIFIHFYTASFDSEKL